MKYIKIFALTLGMLSLTACSDNDDFNTASNVSVEMASSELSVNENAGLINVPVKLSGDANGPVKVQVKVEGCGEIPGVPYVENNGVWSGNYIVTSETLNIPAGESSVNVEIQLVDDIIETGDWTFSVTIVSCEGATIGNTTSTIVTVADNEALPIYELLQGAWKMTYTDRDGNVTTGNVTILGYDEGTEEYNAGALEFWGIAGFDDFGMYAYLVEDNDKFYLELEFPTIFGRYDATHYVFGCGSNKQITSLGELANEIIIRGEFDKATQTISFAPEDKIWCMVASADFSDILGNVGTSTKMSMSR